MIEWLISWKDLVLMWCQDHPAWLYVSLCVLPGLAFPVAPLLILAGIVWGATPKACLIALSAILLNVVWTHLLSSAPCRHLLIRILGDRWTKWKDMPSDQAWRVALILRITPGIPLFLQNYLIGLLGVPLRVSLLLTIPITGTYVCGFVITGGAIFEGKSGLIAAGISLLIVASLAIQWLKKRYAQPSDRTIDPSSNQP